MMQPRLKKVISSHRFHIVAGLVALLGLLTLAVTQLGVVSRMDAEASSQAQDRMTADGTTWAERMADLASTQTALLVTVVGVLVLLATRHWRGALSLALAWGVTQGAVQLFKVAVSRPRPEANEVATAAHGFSFPSAHSATSVAVYATIALILVRASRNGYSRVAVTVCAASLVFAVGLSRVLLAAHYPTDVLAGWTIGALLASLCWLVSSRLLPARRMSLSAAR